MPESPENAEKAKQLPQKAPSKRAAKQPGGMDLHSTKKLNPAPKDHKGKSEPQWPNRAKPDEVEVQAELEKQPNSIAEDDADQKTQNLFDFYANQMADEEEGAANRDLCVITIGEDPRKLIPLSADGKLVELHYIADSRYRGYLLCNGPDCCLCKIGKSKKEFFLLPVYDLIEQRIGVLRIPVNRRPGSLASVLIPNLKKFVSDDQSASFLQVFKKNSYEYVSTIRELPSNIEVCADLVAGFQSKVATLGLGPVLLSAIEQISNAELREFPSIRRELDLEGL